jgi:hypothetical protein
MNEYGQPMEMDEGTDEVLVTKEAEPSLPVPEGDVLLSASLN